jgi:hypothetical protein
MGVNLRESTLERSSCLRGPPKPRGFSTISYPVVERKLSTKRNFQQKAPGSPCLEVEKAKGAEFIANMKAARREELAPVLEDFELDRLTRSKGLRRHGPCAPPPSLRLRGGSEVESQPGPCPTWLRLAHRGGVDFSKATRGPLPRLLEPTPARIRTRLDAHQRPAHFRGHGFSKVVPGELSRRRPPTPARMFTRFGASW